MANCHTCNQTLSNCNCSDTCPVFLKTKCILTTKAYSCIGTTKGATLEVVLDAINAIICGLDPITQITYVVEGCTDEITVTTGTVGNVTTYTVCLDSDITDAIADLQVDVTNILSIISSLPVQLTTSTPEVTLVENSDNNWSIDVTFPTPPSYDGIIHNDTVVDTTSAVVSEQIIKSFNHNYVTNNDIQDGDAIRFSIVGDIDNENTVVFEVFDVASATVMFRIIQKVGSLDPSGSYHLWGEINIRTAASPGAVYSNTYFQNSSYTMGLPVDVSSGDDTFSGRSPQMNIGKNYTLTNGFSNLTLRVSIINSSGTASSSVQSFMVEVRKKI